MFRWFENLIDPYVDYPETDTPPRTLFAFMWNWSQPFKRLFLILTILSIIVAGIEVGLIWYMGRLVDLFSDTTPAEFWAAHAWEMGAMAIFILVLRPMLQGLDVLFLNNGLMPNYGTLYRWRAHKQVLRQSVGWFENDFAGRIANRIMQTPPSAGEAIFQVFDAITFSLAYLVGAVIVLSEADPRLAIPDRKSVV